MSITRVYAEQVRPVKEWKAGYVPYLVELKNEPYNKQIKITNPIMNRNRPVIRANFNDAQDLAYAILEAVEQGASE